MRAVTCHVRDGRDLFLLAMEQLGFQIPLSRWDAVRFWAGESGTSDLARQVVNQSA